MSALEKCRLASAIPTSQQILIDCNFFLDTIFRRFYTFVNCKESLAGSKLKQQRENRHNGNQESSSKEASEEGSQEGSKKEVTRQRNRQHIRGTPKASPEVLLGKMRSPVFMRVSRSTGSFQASPGACCSGFIIRRESQIAGHSSGTVALPSRVISLPGAKPVTRKREQSGPAIFPSAEGRLRRAEHFLTKVLPGYDTFA